jgi:phosphotransferase system HPr (HPr) family protein
MRVRLPEALHARPASLVVRLASQHAAVVRLRSGARFADADKILEVLALGAQQGDEVEILAEGAGAEEAARAIAELVSRNFDGDLVPERGSAAVEGIAIGRALALIAPERAPETRDAAGGATRGPEEERARLARAEAHALEELDALMAAIAPEERALFEPERAILQEVAAGAAERTLAGATSEEAVVAMTEGALTDLLLDVRARLLDSLGDGEAMAKALARVSALGEEVVVVTDRLTPSLVAKLPRQVVGIVARDDEPEAGRTRTSHAAILARGRELPLAMVPAHVAGGITEGDVVLVDTTTPAPARVWVAPSEALVSEARARQRSRERNGAELARAVADVSARLGVALLVNVGSLHDRVPDGVAGVGLLRTELLFAGRASPPGEREQVATILAVARAARGMEVTVRLWDAGGDKPVAWLPPHDAAERGIALLLSHPAVLDTQLAAISRASERANVRILIPMTRTAADVEAVKLRLAALGTRGDAVPVGAMIETPDAADHTATIGRASDFVCVGTNDLAALLVGEGRADATRSVDPRVLAEVARIVHLSHAQGKKVTVCGEIAADPGGARALVGIAVDALSVAPARLTGAVRALEGAGIDDCRAAAAVVAAGTEEGTSS